MGSSSSAFCSAGSSQSCYTGPPGTQGVGPCVGGTETCLPDGSAFGPCQGEVVPQAETCLTPENDDCDAETNEEGAGCVCLPDSTPPCYTGPPGTLGVGPCTAGTAQCDAQGTSLGPCMNEVVPQPEVPDAVDNDCSGVADDPFLDQDMDGFAPTQGDCDDTRFDIGPGAFEFVNTVDDDCDGITDEVDAPCDTGNLAPGVPLDFARAMGLCSFVESAIYAGPVSPTVGRAIVTQFGNATGALNRPTEGAKMGLLTTGNSNTANKDSGLAFDGTLGGACIQTMHPAPQPTPGACGVADPATVCDLSEIRLTLRVPTNAHAFRYSFQFFSAEYPTFRCTRFDDTFLALATTAALGPEQNITFQNGPVSINSTLMDICLDDVAGTPRDMNGDGNVAPGEVVTVGQDCTLENGAAMAGTGFLFDNDVTNNGVPDAPGSQSVGAAATRALTTVAPVQPGELLTLRFLIYDEGDDQLDSLVLLDDFRWLPDPVAAPVTQP